MPATQARPADTAAPITTPSSVMDVTAVRIFDALEQLHTLPSGDVDLLCRGAAGLRFIRSMRTYGELEHELFRIALAELDAIDAYVVEAAACYAADCLPLGAPTGRRPLRRSDQRRVLWLTAILRLAEAFSAHGDQAPEEIYAIWTDEHVYLEFDCDEMFGLGLAHARMRTAALEALTGRSVFIASSAARRGAA